MFLLTQKQKAIKLKMSDQLLPPPAPGSEPISTHAPETYTGKSDEQIAEQIGRISDKLIKRAQDALAQGPLKEGRQYYPEHEVVADDNSVTQRFGEYGTEGATVIERNGKETTLHDIGPEPVFITFTDSKTVNASPDSLRGSSLTGGWGDDAGTKDMSRKENIATSARVLSSTRSGIAKLKQSRNETANK